MHTRAGSGDFSNPTPDTLFTPVLLARTRSRITWDRFGRSFFSRNRLNLKREHLHEIGRFFTGKTHFPVVAMVTANRFGEFDGKGVLNNGYLRTVPFPSWLCLCRPLIQWLLSLVYAHLTISCGRFLTHKNTTVRRHSPTWLRETTLLTRYAHNEWEAEIGRKKLKVGGFDSDRWWEVLPTSNGKIRTAALKTKQSSACLSAVTATLALCIQWRKNKLLYEWLHHLFNYTIQLTKADNMATIQGLSQ